MGPREAGHPGIGLHAEHGAARRPELAGRDPGPAAHIENVSSRTPGDDPGHQTGGIGRARLVVAPRVRAEGFGRPPGLMGLLRSGLLSR